MSKLLGGLATSCGPAIGEAIAKGRENEVEWRSFFDAFALAREWLDEMQPDTVVIFSGDHRFDSSSGAPPAFAVGAAAQYQRTDSPADLSALAPLPGDLDLSDHIAASLRAQNFEIATAPGMKVDQAVTIPYALFWPDSRKPLRIVPIAIDTRQPSFPSARSCFALGRAVGQAILSFTEPRRAVVLGTGGLSRRLDPARPADGRDAFDLSCLDRLIHAPDALIDYLTPERIAQAQARGVEVLTWLAMRGALSGAVSLVHRNYSVTPANMATAMIVLNHHPT